MNFPTTLENIWCDDTQINERGAPIKRVAAKDFPIPFSPPLEDYVLPKVSEVVEAVRMVTYR